MNATCTVAFGAIKCPVVTTCALTALLVSGSQTALRDRRRGGRGDRRKRPVLRPEAVGVQTLAASRVLLHSLPQTVRSGHEAANGELGVDQGGRGVGAQVVTTRIKDIFDYDPDTGILRWKYRPGHPKQWNVRYPGSIAGTPHYKDGVQIRVDRINRPAHVLIWEWMTGSPPQKGMFVDHRDGNSTNNTWGNLRLATPSQNVRNSRARGEWPKGVYRNKKGRFVAQIKYKGVNNYLGSFNTPEEAHEAYKVEAKRVFGEFACWER